jgi:di/tricarboxylate transporter
LAIIALAIMLFSFEWVPADVVALGVLVSLILTGLLPTEEAFAGFGSETVLMILGLFILIAALLRTGVVEMAGRAILRFTGEDLNRLLAVVMVASAGLGALISNTASTAFFVPIVIGLANRARLNASRLLMPLAVASIVTSSVTLVSTSSNIVISGLMTVRGMSPMGMFELAPVGLPVAAVGVLYMYTLGRRLIPERRYADEPERGLGIRAYFTEVLVLPDSPLAGKTLAESGLGRDLDLTVLRIIRHKDRYLAPRANRSLQVGDLLLVEGRRDEILKVKDTVGIDIKGDVSLADPQLQSDEIHLVETILLPGSPLIGRSLKRLRFRERYGLQVLAIYRQGETIRQQISELRLQVGDVLLVQGPRANVAWLAEDEIFSVIGEVEEKRPNLPRARVAVAAFMGSLALVSFNVVSLPVGVLIGALVVFLTGCLTPEEAYRQVDWRALILIGSMLGLGSAMEHTGAAQFLARGIVARVGNANPLWLLAAFFAITVVLTQPMAHQAAAIIVVPIAIQTALGLGLNPRTFAMMIAVAANTSFLTPLEPACLMVYGPGGYRFADFLKVGLPLTLLIFAVAIALVPRVWPLL